MAQEVAHRSRISVTRVKPSRSSEKETSLHESQNRLSVAVVPKKSVSHLDSYRQSIAFYSVEEQETSSFTAF
jgi:hypothetical protein